MPHVRCIRDNDPSEVSCHLLLILRYKNSIVPGEINVHMEISGLSPVGEDDRGCTLYPLRCSIEEPIIIGISDLPLPQKDSFPKTYAACFFSSHFKKNLIYSFILHPDNSFSSSSSPIPFTYLHSILPFYCSSVCVHKEVGIPKVSANHGLSS